MSQTDNLIPNHKKSGIDSTLCVKVACDKPLESS
jgi:hypothetical protein